MENYNLNLLFRHNLNKMQSSRDQEPANTFYLMNRGRYPSAYRTWYRAAASKAMSRTVSRKKSTLERQTSISARKVLKKLLDKQVERKYIISRGSNVPVATTSAATPYALSLLPSLPVGASRHSRVGNDITPKKLCINGRVNLLPYNVTTNPVCSPIAVKMWVLSSVSYNEIGVFSGSPAATAFFKSDTTPAGMSGNVLDLTQEVDDENFKVLMSKTIYLGLTSPTNTFPSTGVSAFDNSQFSAGFYFDFSKYFPKLQYNDTSASSIPTNKNCWLVIQPVALDGSSTSLTPIEIHYTLTSEFTDL